ncbi:ATP-binding protein [Halomicrobium katesii]|uniref:ATP-binding protein n=1 Tax=Halomicrobium katesii TaxID=437163 RepID=UPI00037775DF|nr:AAA family ATPase [Halomicrobium katesii]
MYDRFGDHLQAEFDRILFAVTAVAESDEDGDPIGPFGASLSTVGERVRSLAGREQEDRVGTDLPETLARRAASIERDIAATRGTDVDLRLDRLTREFELSRPDLDAFLLVLAPVFDRSVCNMYGRIQGTGEPVMPTVDFVERLLIEMGHGREDEAPAPATVLSPTSPLFEYGLLRRRSAGPSRPDAFDRLSVDDRIVQYLKGDDTLDPALDGIATLERADRRPDALVFDDETADTVAAIDRRSSAAETPTIFYCWGEAGTGRDRLPAALTDAETPLLRADADAVLRSPEVQMRLHREAALRDAAIHLEDLGAVTDDDEPSPDADGDAEAPLPVDDAPEPLSVDEITELVDEAPADVFLSHTDAWTPEVELSGHRLEICACPFPDQSVRERVWAEYAAEFADEELITHIATNFRLPQRDIRRAVRTARYLCRTGTDADDIADEDLPTPQSDDDAFAPVDGGLTREHLYEACKRYSASNLETLAEPIDPGYSWDDIALNDRQESHLRELCGHLQYRGAVTSEWGFGEPGSRGDGVVALFYGQPGTGKTMAAEIIANETGLDLYRVDLSQIINKYVGETESRLATLLDEAERSNAILLFDEADSIFGKRAEVKDATDRYANTEINFLLQRLESFDGILLLTTNKRSGIDSAFKRRIQHSIAFEKPQELIRRQFWTDVFPDDADVATETFDYEFLGRITTTPALIRKVAKYAAYIAATEAHEGRPLADGTAQLDDVTITFDHVLRALQYAREAGGAGFQVNYGEYEDRLREYETHGVERDWETELERFRGTDDESQTSVDDDGASPAATDDGTTREKGSAERVDPGDGRSPETVVREFFSRLSDADERAHELYHSDAVAEEFSHRSLRLMKHGDLSIEGEIDRHTNDQDRVVLGFHQQLAGSHVPDDIDGRPLPVRCELRPERDGWRIFDITKVDGSKQAH